MLKPFEYHKPSALADAVALLAQENSKALAGGMTLLPAMRQWLAEPSALVDLSGLEELKGVRSHNKRGLVLGAMTTHVEVATAPLVLGKIPALASLAGGIGDAQVRHCGTVGGSLANNDPAADYPAALLALGGSVHTNKRTIDAADYFDGLFTTVLEEDEIILHLHFPPPKRGAYAKFRQPASLYALVGVFIAQTDDGVRVAVTGAGDDGVFRATELEKRLNGEFSPTALDGAKLPADELMSDLHGSAEYRASLIVTMAKRAVAACC